MRPRLRAACLMSLLFAAAPTLLAQWPPYAPSDVPKGPDGKPNLTAPAPRMANGKPDFSGVWANVRQPAGQRGQTAPPVTSSDGPPVATFRDVGANFKDGLPLQPWAADLIKKRRAENQKDNPDALCLPMGFMQFHTHGQPRKIVQTPSVMVIIFEPNYGLRQIFTDGRTLPANDPQPWWYGYSIGKWDGDTMVVETTGLRDGGWLDIWGTPFTDAAKITERFRRVNYGTLEIDVTVDDPKAYTKPWTVRVNQRIMADGELIEFICNENQQFTSYLAGAARNPGASR